MDNVETVQYPSKTHTRLLEKYEYGHTKIMTNFNSNTKGVDRSDLLGIRKFVIFLSKLWVDPVNLESPFLVSPGFGLQSIGPIV